MPTVDESIGGSIPLSGLLHELCASSPGDSVEIMARFRLTLFLACFSTLFLPVSPCFSRFRLTLFLPCFSQISQVRQDEISAARYERAS
jgi:hypothetical protein